MKTIDYQFRDKSKWGDGPWQSEPDKVQFTDEATGMPCLIVRNRSGALCGYVGVAEGHPMFGINYHKCNEPGCPQHAKEWPSCDHVPEHILRVHGGITFSDFCHETPDHHGVCHIPEEGEPDRVWWFGFDCAHAGDKSPAYKEFMPDWKGMGEYETYKDMQYVKGEIADLAQQLAAIGKPDDATVSTPAVPD